MARTIKMMVAGLSAPTPCPRTWIWSKRGTRTRRASPRGRHILL